MPSFLEVLDACLRFRLDAVAFAALGLAGCYGCWLMVGCRHAQRDVSKATCGLVAIILLAGLLAAEWIQNQRRESLTASLSALSPTLAHEIERMGHANIPTPASPNDQTNQAISSAEGEWLRLNHPLARLFTYRVAPNGTLQVVTEPSGGDRGAPLAFTRAAPADFRQALIGEARFYSKIEHPADRASVWSLTPLHDASGRVEAALALGYPAGIWIGALAEARAIALGGAAFLLGVLLASATLVALMRSEIREHAETARQLHLAKTAADEANSAKSDFLAVMSHEIRTPLNAVMGFANLLSETKLDDSQRDYVATITGEGIRLSSLVNDILDLSKIDEGRLVMERLPFAPAETAHEVLRLLSGRALEKKIDLRFEAQFAGPLLVAGDPLRFHQVLVNLVDNAIKFTSQGAVTLFLHWTPLEDGTTHGHLRVRVRDTGIGIAADKVKDLFQKFMQADTSMTRRYGGTGLGLAICQRLVGLMGGEIKVTSTKGEGAEFAFTLPFAAVALPGEPALPEPEAVGTRAKPPRILVVDDMETNRFLLEVFLRRNGFEPELASGGAEAVELASRKQYDAILMDLHMPDVDGFTATQRIRAAEPPGHHTPIIALTASIAKGTREKCLAAGMDEHLTKPLDLRKFKALLNSFIDPNET